MPKIFIFAYAAHGRGLSGGDRIFIEFARRWQRKVPIKVFVNDEGSKMCRRQDLRKARNLKYDVWNSGCWKKFGFVVGYFSWIFYSIYKALTLRVEDPDSLIVYSASEFWMDSLPAFILKLRFPKIEWVAAWYQTAPNPFKGYAEGSREDTYNFKALLYWLAQLPVKPVVSRFADFVLVNNESERREFPELDRRKRLMVVIGAIDLKKINKWQKAHGKPEKIYDAVFQGRFHPQKGVVELVEIWRKLISKKPDAKLVMIGDGPLMEEVKRRIDRYGLAKNVSLLGYVFDGDLKYKTFSQSKIVVHPALYDSGGMASAEAMAFGLPVVGFNLKAYESYYPEGMVKVEVGDNKAFASKILELLDSSDKRKKLAAKAVSMLHKKWTWDDRADEVLAFIRYE